MQLNNTTLIKFSSHSLFVRYALPSIIGMIMSNMAVLIDGMFVAKFVGSNAFAAINIVWPVTSITFGIYIMFTIGSVAIAGKYIGMGKIKRANLIFTHTILIANIMAVMPLIAVYIFRDKILPIFGAHEEVLSYALEYIPLILLGSFFCGFSYVLSQFAKLNGSPKFVSFVLIVGALTNIVLDFIFIAVIKMGIYGAALGTCISYIVSLIVISAYFFRSNCRIKIVKIYGGFGYTLKSAINGFSEFLSQTSNGLIPWLFNITAYKIAGNGGILAYSVANYALMFFSMLAYALADSLQPLISISFGARKECKMKAFLKIAIISISVIAFISVVVLSVYPEILVNILLRDVNIDTYKWSIFFLRMTAFAFIGVGINIVMSAYYTSVQCAGASAIIASLRSLILPLALLLTLPSILGILGLIIVLPISEIITLFVSILLFKKRTPSILLSVDTII